MSTQKPFFNGSPQASKPTEQLESPFLDDELFERKSEEEWVLGAADIYTLTQPVEGEVTSASSSCEPGRFERDKFNVVVWKDRITPGRRRIPKALKLAILARGRIRLPIEQVRWLLDLFKQSGWVSQLTVDLPSVLPEVDVTFELFLNQRAGQLRPAQINSIFNQYLKLRQAKYLKNCPYILHITLLAVEKAKLESRLGITSLDSLFKRARVPSPTRMSAGDRDRYWLLVYASFPVNINRYIASQPKIDISPPPRPIQTMPSLRGLLTPAGYYKLRKEPGTNSEVLGQMTGLSIPVSITNKAKKDSYVWYQIVLGKALRVKKQDQLIELPEGAQCWVVDKGLLARVANWDFLRHQLIQFENANKTLGLNERITKLRQMGHVKDLPFDWVIGTKPGQVYQDTRPFEKDVWQIVKDYNAVQAPDGKWVDVSHILVGLDVLRAADRPVYIGGTYIGHAYAAATWAGDIGAAAADATLRWSKEWEKRNPKATETERIQLYYGTRAPEWDLLGDLDAWGIHALRSPDLDSIDKLLASYYQNIWVEDLGRTLTTHRQDAIERFLSHYGFEIDYDRHIRDYPVLVKQKAKDETRHQIRTFGSIWMFRHKPFRGSQKPDYVPDMANRFLYWLEGLAIENGATVI